VAVYSSFPDHSHHVISTLLDTGFLSKEHITVDGQKVRPLEAAIEILRRRPMPKGYTEKENLWVKVYGQKDGKEHVEEMDCMAYTIPGWEDATCNVDTGFPISIGAQMIKNKEIDSTGVFSPEAIIPPEPFFKHLGDHQLEIYDNGKRIN
jgi:saccharopine dehydrogenase-like NADP-dependent oxidoreductase